MIKCIQWSWVESVCNLLLGEASMNYESPDFVPSVFGCRKSSQRPEAKLERCGVFALDKLAANNGCNLEQMMLPYGIIAN